MLTLTHKTTDEQIQSATVKELRETLKYHLGDLTGNKPQLVERVKDLRNGMLALHRRNEEYKEEIRQQQIAEEITNEAITASLEGLVHGFKKLYAQHVNTTDEFRREMTEEVTIESILQWKAEKALKSEAITSFFHSVLHYLGKQLEERTQTWDEIVAYLTELRDEGLDQLVNDEQYRHDSTNEMSSIINRAKFAAVQYRTRVLTNVLRGFKWADEAKDIDGVKVAIACSVTANRCKLQEK